MNPERIGGYEILSELGRGAMGVVYRGRDAAIGRPVAIKVIRIDAGTTMQQGAELRQRLIREASVAGNISHPGIVTVYQLGEEGDAVFIAMEFVEGSSLESLLANATHDRDWVLDILAQIAVALDYAHKANVVHRDIKPANILVRSDGRVKIADFGIAKLTAGATSGMTGTGMSVGSPAYMSPEQVQATAIDGRSDQFALATMAFQMLAGRMPFKGNTAVTLMFQIVTADPFAPQTGDIPLAPNVRAVLARALSKNPNDRFPTCAAFIQELTTAVEGKTTGVRPASAIPHTPAPAPLVSTPPPAPAPFVPASAPAHQPAASKSWMLFPIIGGLLTLALIGGGIYWWYSHQADQPAQAGQPTTGQPTQPPPEKETARKGTDSGPKASSGTPLLAAVASGNVDAVKSALAKGANVNEADHEGTTPLMLASEGSAPIVAELLTAGAQVDAVDAQGRSALSRASAAGKADAMSLLLDHGANLNARAGDSSTPLLEAVKHGRLEAAQLLIDRGADVNVGDSTNTTPLMAAADTSAEIPNPGDLIKLLLKHGAKRGMKDSQGRIAFQRAVASNNAAAVALLR